MNIYEKLKIELTKILEENNLSKETIIIQSKTLTDEDAIGITERKDFPILTGKEIMLQADFKGSIEQAFTSAPTVYTGTLGKIVDLDLENDDHAKGLFIASLNAIMRHLALIDGTIHCRNEEPELCAVEFENHFKEKYRDFKIRVLDLSPKNIGKDKFGIEVEHGIDSYDDVVLQWADVVLCTGSTICNGSIVRFLNLDKEVIFFGTTIAGAAEILGLKRLCFEGA